MNRSSSRQQLLRCMSKLIILCTVSNYPSFCILFPDCVPVQQQGQCTYQPNPINNMYTTCLTSGANRIYVAAIPMVYPSPCSLETVFWSFRYYAQAKTEVKAKRREQVCGQCVLNLMSMMGINWSRYVVQWKCVGVGDIPSLV